MADVTIQIHYITSGLGGGGLYMTGQYIRVIGDGSAIRAELWTASTGGSLIGVPSGGPNLSGDGIVVSSGSFLDPQECIGDDLQYYTVKGEWPYADHHLSADHPSCAIIVCDLDITGYTTVNETAVGASNGSISLTATSSNGAIEFGLTDFTYGTGQASPITGLPTGNYIVYAKDAAGCTDQVNVFVDIDFTYGVKWRTEYDHVKPKNYVTRIDIEQRDYVGDVIWADSGETPFTLEYNKKEENQLVPSEATVQLLVRRGEEGKFNDIRLGDDQQHVVKKYIDRGDGWELEWLGYVSPEFYEEPYIFEPYVISIKAIDGLGELKNKPFVMDTGDDFFGSMSVIKIISECLKKLPIDLNINSCINIFEENMEMDAEDDPLAQAFIKAENFRGKNCEEVLNSLIKPFTGAELFQSLGLWWIRTKEQAVDTTIAYRTFDPNGDYVSNSTIDARKSLGFPRTTSRLCWVDRTALLRYTRPLGNVTITHVLDKDNNMIDEGGFELEDIDPSTEFFRNWNLFPLQAGISSGLEYVDNGDSKSAFYFSWTSSVDDQALNSLVSQAMPISIGADYGTGNVFDNAGTSFKLKFQVYLSPTYKVDWIWMGWRLRFTDVDSGDFWDWIPTSGGPLTVTPPTNVERINDLYVSDYHSWKTYEFLNFRFPGPTTSENYTIQLSFYFHNHRGRDFSSYAELRDVVTETGAFSSQTPSMEGKRYYVAIGDNTYYYRLENSTDDESEPNIIRPDDWNLISNPYQWILKANYNPDGDVPLLEKILIDNVSLSMFSITPNLEGPGVFLIDPPETATYSDTITTRNESSLNEEVFNGDAPPIVGAAYIYNGFFTLADGTPTKYWGRVSVEGERSKLLDIYKSYLTAQGAQSKRILSGSAIADIQIGYINSVVDGIDNKKYRFLRFALNDKHGQYDFEAEETLVGDDGESPPALGSYSLAYSDGYYV